MRGMQVAFGVLLSANVAAAPPVLEQLLKPSQHGLVTVSPGGQYIAATSRIDDKMMLIIFDRLTLKPVRVLDPEKDGAIARVSWVNAERVFVMNSRTGGTVEQAFLEPYIVAVNVDGSRKREFYASVIDTLLDDDEHVLISRCGKTSMNGCWPFVQKVDTDGGRAGPRIADAPMLNADFMADKHGQIRFAYGWDDHDVQQVSILEAGKWMHLNDESATGVEVMPIGVSRDGALGFLRSERIVGPDVIEQVVFATGERKVLLSDPRLDPSFIVWSADGAEPIGAAYGLEVPRARFWNPEDPDAKLLRQLEAAFPEDAVSFLNGSRDGQHVVVGVWSDRDPGSYFILDRTGKHTSLIARERPWLDPAALARSQAISFPSRDGLELTGYLTLPTQTTAQRPPLVVLPHGGPFDVADEWGYDEEVQVLATHGYAVLRVNFRGSAGFGRSFVESGYRQWGLKMQDDVTDATRWIVAQGEVDPARICIWGSSYGGYAALMGAIQAPDLYKCTIATAAVTDLNLHWKWGDTHRTKWGRNYLEEALGKDPEKLHSASPVKHAAKIQADVMLVHGVHDDRVSYEHAKAMRVALDAVGKPYEGYFPADETHGIHGHENRKEYYMRVLRFLATRIGGEPPAIAAAH